jgi:hypothetical protein
MVSIGRIRSTAAAITHDAFASPVWWIVRVGTAENRGFFDWLSALPTTLRYQLAQGKTLTHSVVDHIAIGHQTLERVAKLQFGWGGMAIFGSALSRAAGQGKTKTGKAVRFAINMGGEVGWFFLANDGLWPALRTGDRLSAWAERRGVPRVRSQGDERRILRHTATQQEMLRRMNLNEPARSRVDFAEA